MGCDGGGAHVHRHAPGVLPEARPHGNDLAAVVHRDGDFPPTLAQRNLQLLKHPDVTAQTDQAPLVLQRLLHAAQIPGGVVHIGFLHLDVVQADQRIDLDVARLGCLAHHLAVYLAACRDVDHHIAQHLGRARQPATSVQATALGVVFLDVAEGRKVSRA